MILLRQALFLEWSWASLVTEYAKHGILSESAHSLSSAPQILPATREPSLNWPFQELFGLSCMNCQVPSHPLSTNDLSFRKTECILLGSDLLSEGGMQRQALGRRGSNTCSYPLSFACITLIPTIRSSIRL